MKITNTQPGARGVNTITGTVLIDPKQTVDVEVYAREQSHIEASGWFEVEGDYTPDPESQSAPVAPAGGDTEIADLKAKVEDLTGQVKAKDTEIADLKKLVPETDVDKMTVPELRAFLAYRDIKWDATKDKKDDLVTLAKAAS